jgi:hypothetical protein
MEKVLRGNPTTQRRHSGWERKKAIGEIRRCPKKLYHNNLDFHLKERIMLIKLHGSTVLSEDEAMDGVRKSLQEESRHPNELLCQIIKNDDEKPMLETPPLKPGYTDHIGKREFILTQGFV